MVIREKITISLGLTMACILAMTGALAATAFMWHLIFFNVVVRR